MGELKALFRPEFLNRVDDIIVFHKLTKEDTQKDRPEDAPTLEKKLQDMDIQWNSPRQPLRQWLTRAMTPPTVPVLCAE